MEKRIFTRAVIFFLFFQLCFSATRVRELRQVTVIFRHGDRFPARSETPFMSVFSNDIDSTKIGILTQKGLRRAYKLGKFLKNRYHAYFDDSCPRNTITAYSTNATRTISSLEQVLMANYPDKRIVSNAEKISGCEFLPINIVNKSNHILHAVEHPIYKYREFPQVDNSEEVVSRREEFKPLLKELSQLTHHNISKVDAIFHLMSYLDSHLSMGKQVPQWVWNYGYDIIKGAKFYFDQWSYNDALKRFNGGMLIKRILQDIELLKTKYSSDFKLNLYSGHDLTVYGVLQSLNIKLETLPYYTSAVIFEVWEHRGIYFIKVMYYDGRKSESMNPLMELQLTKCDVFCSVDQFRRILKSHIPSDSEFESNMIGKGDEWPHPLRNKEVT